MRTSNLFFFFLLLGSACIVFLSCSKKDKVDSSPGLKLAFSTDTVLFDTVFPTVGSITQRLVVYNRNKNKVSIASIRLAGGQASSYRINIDGTPATSVSEVEIAGDDSIFIFVRVTIDPQNQALPYIVSDSIEFLTNGNSQQVKLVAWGKDAIFYRKASLAGNIVWDSLKAHVIYDSLRIDTNSSLTIMPGTKVYFHKDAYLAVSYQSSLKIAGTLFHPVLFQGDRMDAFYKDLPGQWGGIYLEQGSRDHEINYLYIKNGSFGLAVYPPEVQTATMLTISNSIIQNMTAVALYAMGTSINAVNCVFGNCGGNCLSVNYGGEYDFRYLTVGNYWYASVRHAPSIYLSNYTYVKGNKISNPLSKSYFANVIVYGSNDDEIGLDSVAGIPFEYMFDHALLKTKLKTTNPLRYSNCIINKDPVFVDEYKMNYAIDSISPAIKMGQPLGIPYDIRGAIRGQPPALGAYEYVKIE